MECFSVTSLVIESKLVLGTLLWGFKSGLLRSYWLRLKLKVSSRWYLKGQDGMSVSEDVYHT
jgi:hypothetical protein